MTAPAPGPTAPGPTAGRPGPGVPDETGGAAGTGRLRVVIAEDAVLLREALAALLERAGLIVAAQVGDASALHAAVAATAPEVAIVDIRMPPTHRLEGLRAAVELRAGHPGLGVLLLSQHVEVQYLRQLLGADARGVGYLLKERVGAVDEFLAAVRRVAAGGCVLDPEIVSAMLGARRRDGRWAALSQREREVLALMAEGRSNDAIARTLRLGPKTVESHVRRIFQRLDLPDEPDDHRRVLAVLTHLRSADA
ncbi:MAG TPA: response regulator transcription factor [Mycobacteriales bacterium]|nr:response regulator transcription factor [Mycobacteriales bacterium]